MKAQAASAATEQREVKKSHSYHTEGGHSEAIERVEATGAGCGKAALKLSSETASTSGGSSSPKEFGSLQAALEDALCTACLCCCGRCSRELVQRVFHRGPSRA